MFTPGIECCALQPPSNNGNITINYDANSNLFSRSKKNGSINLVNGNVTFQLKNLEYDDNGVFTLKIFKSEKLGVM